MQINEALEKLFSLHNFGVKLGLENIKNFLKLLGNPQDNLKTIHVAGSNGKGSTSSFIASILTEAGFKTGLYTSPHFVKFNERVRINNIQINNEFITEFLGKYFDYILANGLTFFEVTTALAFVYFKEKKVDYAVIETGLGGRLDATNVIVPLASVITSISLEHTNILGTTYSQIAFEKAGIIKPGVNTFIGCLNEEAKKTISGKCIELNSQLFEVKDYLKTDNCKISFSDSDFFIENLSSPLRGDYQLFNAALAILTVSKTFNLFNREIILRGLANVLINSGIEGRFENFSVNPLVILDAAHNIEGVEVFLKEFKKESAGFKKKILLFGVMKDKSLEVMISMLGKSFDEIVFTEIDYERCAGIDELLLIADKLNIKAGTTLEPDKYIKEFILSADKDSCLVVLGSIYVLGEIKTRFSKQIS